ncbi:hypothetical protein VNO80_26486 [Phaseolus coccineus]|uniref:Uncharacterized protein n=1 Tax=Phaseolus coccineus TaxID=3886 RepID=A0AAN9LEU8_PHACN
MSRSQYTSSSIYVKFISMQPTKGPRVHIVLLSQSTLSARANVNLSFTCPALCDLAVLLVTWEIIREFFAQIDSSTDDEYYNPDESMMLPKRTTDSKEAKKVLSVAYKVTAR